LHYSSGLQASTAKEDRGSLAERSKLREKLSKFVTQLQWNVTSDGSGSSPVHQAVVWQWLAAVLMR
jgi:hypothetical protein